MRHSVSKDRSRPAHKGRHRLAYAIASVVGITAFDVVRRRRSARKRARGAAGEERGAQLASKAITIHRPVGDVYRFWRELTNLPRFMTYLEAVEPAGDGRAHFRMKAPGGVTIDWTTTITEDLPDERIAWRSDEGSDVMTAGAVRFIAAPGDQGTEVHVELSYEGRGGPARDAIAALAGTALGPKLRGDLHRLKQLLETGQIARSDASVHRGPHAAQPPETATTPKEDLR